MQPASPLSERSDLIDALRGFALFGVLMVNLRSLTLYEFMPATERALLPSAPIDRYFDVLLAAAIDLKSITLFTLLFGVGFAMQMQRPGTASARNAHFARRMLVLLAIGLLHAYLFWWGDILRYYALTGLLLIPLARWSPRALAVAGCAVLLIPPIVQPWIRPLLPALQPSAEAAAAAMQAFSSADPGDMLAGNLQRDLRMRIAIWMLPFFVLGRVLIGVAIGRSGVLFEPDRHRVFWRRCLLISAPLGVLLTGWFLVRDHSAFGAAMPWPQGDIGRMLMRMLREAAPVALGLAYMSAFVVLFEHARTRRWLSLLAPLGRMALSHYLMHSLIGIALFYGIGLGIGARYGLVGVVVACVLIFVAQIFISRIWLAHFRFGPAEWLWRGLTCGQLPPLRRSGFTSKLAATTATGPE